MTNEMTFEETPEIPPTNTIGELIASWLLSEICMLGTVIVSLPLPAGHSPTDEPEAASVLAAAIASRSEHSPSFAAISELVETAIVVLACASKMEIRSRANTMGRIKANNSLLFRDVVFIFASARRS